MKPKKINTNWFRISPWWLSASQRNKKRNKKIRKTEKTSR